MAALGMPLAAAGVAQAHEHAGEGQGSLVYAPISVNNCGNTVNTVGFLNPAFGNTCVNQGDSEDGVQTGDAAGPSVSDLALPDLPTSVPAGQ
ncbi:chaplin [Actinomycetospora chlora]|uniref:chaplin n=1 Tax=Actinomycetospora chlora TaxID=663608 RepID=UPI0031F0D23D